MGLTRKRVTLKCSLNFPDLSLEAWKIEFVRTLHLEDEDDLVDLTLVEPDGHELARRDVSTRSCPASALHRAGWLDSLVVNRG